MQIRKLLIVGAIIASLSFVSSFAYAGLSQVLVPNTLNTFEDQSRELIVDFPDATGATGTLSDGDVFFGFISLDNRTVPSPLGLAADEVAIVFTAEVANLTAIPVGPSTSYTLDLVPITNPLAAPYTLPALTGVAGVGGQIAAVYSDLGFDPLTTRPSGAGTDLVGQIADIAALGTFDFQAAELTAVDGLTSNALFTTGLLTDPFANLALLNGATLGGGIGGLTGFGGGLEIVPAGVDVELAGLIDGVDDYSRLVPSNDTGGNHEVVIANGGLSGASDILYAGENILFTAGQLPGVGVFNTPANDGVLYNVYGLSNNADFSVFPRADIPEPSAILVWSLLGGLGLGIYRVRRGKK